MSAEDLGMRELGQVRSQRLDELLTTLRLLHDPSSNSKLGIPALDKLLAHHTKQYDPTNLSAIPAPPIIEITSPVPKSGKTGFLYWVIASLVLGCDGPDPTEEIKPDDADEFVDGGRTTLNHPGDDRQDTEEHPYPDETTAAHTAATAHQATDRPDHLHNDSTPGLDLPSRHNEPTPKAVAFLSTHPINIPRLSQILLQHLLTTSPHLLLAEAQAKVHTALSHIHIYQPTSLSSLIATLSSLPNYFLSPSNPSRERRLGTIIISTPSDYFWEDKVAGATQPQGQGQGQAKSKFPALATTMKRVAMVLQTPVFYTTSQFSGPSTSTTATSTSTNPSDPNSLPLTSTSSLPPALPPPFVSIPTLRLIISRKTIQGFSIDIDAETALRQQGARDIAVREAVFKVVENRWGRDGSGERERERDGNGRGFEIKIDDSGVRVI